jgi:hypothetical protein
VHICAEAQRQAACGAMQCSSARQSHVIMVCNRLVQSSVACERQQHVMTRACDTHTHTHKPATRRPQPVVPTQFEIRL